MLGHTGELRGNKRRGRGASQMNRCCVAERGENLGKGMIKLNANKSRNLMSSTAQDEGIMI